MDPLALAPARCCQRATVRSSSPNAATMAWIGQPYASSVTTTTTCSRAVRSRYSAVPAVSANVRRHRLHRYRRSARLWITTCPSPFRP